MFCPDFAADKPPRPFLSKIYDDSSVESELLSKLCEKTLVEAQSQVLAVGNLISDIDEVLKAPLFGDSMSESGSPLSESPIFDDSQMPESPIFDSQTVVPETEFPDSPIFNSVNDETVVPETEFPEIGQNLPDLGFPAARGGDWRSSMEEPVAVMAEETDSEPQLSPVREEMLRILLPAYFKLVSSFLYDLLPSCSCGEMVFLLLGVAFVRWYWLLGVVAVRWCWLLVVLVTEMMRIYCMHCFGFCIFD